MEFYVVADVVVAIVADPSLLGRALGFSHVQKQRSWLGNVDREIEASAIAQIGLLAE